MTPSATLFPITDAGAPACSECETDLHRAGRGQHSYWSCRYCGTTVPVEA